MLASTYVLRAQEVLIYSQQEHSANYIGASSYSVLQLAATVAKV
jgi:hypothetical protein